MNTLWFPVGRGQLAGGSVGYSGIPLKGSEGYLRKRRKDIFGRGSEIPRPCIRRPVARWARLI